MVEINTEAREILDSTRKVKGPPGLTSQQTSYSLRSFLQKRFIPGVELALSKGKKVTFIVGGNPDSGKTYLLEKINRLISILFPDVRRGTVRFEDGLRDLKDLGGLTSGIQGLRPHSEYEAASKLVVPRMVDAIKNNDLVTAEFVVISALPIDGQLVDVDCGSSTAFPLWDGKGPFEELETENYLVLLTGGRDMREGGLNYRRVIKATDELPEQEKLPAQQRIAALYGKAIPQTSEEGKLMVLEGANAEVILHFGDISAENIFSLRKLGRDVPNPRDSNLGKFTQQRRYEVKLFKIIDKILQNYQRISPDHIFYGYNNPPIQDLPRSSRETLMSAFDNLANPSPYNQNL